MKRRYDKSAELRYLKALELRRQGKTLEQIGLLLGVKKERARQLARLGQALEARRAHSPARHPPSQ